MIGYLTNNFDKTWKLCTQETFYNLLRSPLVASTIAEVRNGNKQAKRKLPAFLFCGIANQARYQEHLAQCQADGTKPKGSRCEEFLQSNGLFMMDFDRTEGNAYKLYEKFLQTMRSHQIATEGLLALAHRTPGGYGLRLVLKRRAGSTIEADQRWIATLMNEEIDLVCKDLSRLSYAVTMDDIFFIDNELLFTQEIPHALHKEDAQVGTQHDASVSAQSIDNHSELTTQHSAPAPYPTAYDGIPYETILHALEDQLGGIPEHGSRNNFIFSMACHLRYICNDDPQWIGQLLPTYGEATDRVERTIRSACNRAQSREFPQLLYRVLKQAKAAHQLFLSGKHQSTPPPMPEKLPTVIQLLVSKVPYEARPAVAHAVFPSMGSHLNNVRFRYIDNVEHEATFMCVLLAKQSSGKSAVNKPIEYIMADIKQRDNENRAREQAWKDSLNTKGSNKEKPKRPTDLCIQILSSDMTNAALVQRLQDSNGRFLYTQMDEIELMNQLKTSSRSNNISQIIRLAFDCGLYGQERVSAQSVTAQVRLRWNWNASATIKKGKDFFSKSLIDGTLSRINFCTINPARNGKVPVYGTYDDAFAAALKPYIDRLNNAVGLIECDEAHQLAQELSDANAERACLSDDEAFETLSYRANVIAFLKAMTLYVAEGGWSDEIAQFVRWSEEYDLWCKMHFFGDKLQTELNEEEIVVRPGKRNLLELLPNRFSKQELANIRRAQGMREDPMNQIYQWKQRGYIVQDEATQEYIITGKYKKKST